jgi:hypothetical protein
VADRSDAGSQIASRDSIVNHAVVPCATRGDGPLTLTAAPATYTLAWVDGDGYRILDLGADAEVAVDLAWSVANALRLSGESRCQARRRLSTNHRSRDR